MPGSSTVMEAGATLGVISSPFSSDEIILVAETDGIVICVSNLPLVNEGEALFHIALFEESAAVEAEIANHKSNIQDDRLFEIEAVPASDTDSVS